MLAFLIIIIPFIGTTAGSAAVFFLRKDVSEGCKKILLGFAAGVMLAASVWSLILPSIDLAVSQGLVAWFPATAGFIAGIVFLLFTEKQVTRLTKSRENGSNHNNFSNDIMLFLAVTLHNIPEGMAVGVACAAAFGKTGGITAAAALSLSVGIAIQNFPEGAIISMPLLSGGYGKIPAFIYGTLSGAVEPAAAAFTLVFVSKITALLPYLLSFAAGAMFYVTVEDLIPECRSGSKSGIAASVCAAGFLIMMVLDVALG